jgi:hypothetical protein
MECNRNREVTFRSRNKLTPYAMRFALCSMRLNEPPTFLWMTLNPNIPSLTPQV